MAPTQERELPDAVPEMSFWWALLSNRGQRGGVAIAGILLRQAVPLIGVLILHWSTQQFLLLAMVNFGWNWAMLGAWNTTTSALVKAHRGGNPVPAGTWIQMTLISAVVFCVVTGCFGFPIYFMSPTPLMLDRIWWASTVMTLLTPLPGIVDAIREDAAANLSDGQIQAFAKQRRQLLLVSIIPIVGAYGLLFKFPYPITLTAVAVGYVLFSTLCELRPDLAAEFARELPPE